MCLICSVTSFQTCQYSIPRRPMDQVSGCSLTYSSWSCHHWHPAVIDRLASFFFCALESPLEELNCGGNEGTLAQPTSRLMALGSLCHTCIDLLANWYPPLCEELATKSHKRKAENSSPQWTGTKTSSAMSPKSQLIFKISPRVPCNLRAVESHGWWSEKKVLFSTEREIEVLW